jgi:hypothetical protein
MADSHRIGRDGGGAMVDQVTCVRAWLAQLVSLHDYKLAADD